MPQTFQSTTTYHTLVHSSAAPTVTIGESVDIKESKAKANVARVCTSYYMVLKPSRRLLTGALKLACSLMDATLVFVHIFVRNAKRQRDGRLWSAGQGRGCLISARSHAVIWNQ